MYICAGCLLPATQAWAKCVSWLLEEESLSRVDVLFQGLFALGLACSYCPLAAKRVRWGWVHTLNAKSTLENNCFNSRWRGCVLARMHACVVVLACWTADAASAGAMFAAPVVIPVPVVFTLPATVRPHLLFRMNIAASLLRV